MQGERGAVPQSDVISRLSDLDGLFWSELIAGRRAGRLVQRSQMDGVGPKGNLMSIQNSVETNSDDATFGWTGLTNQHASPVLSRCPVPTRTGVSIDAPNGPASYGRMFSELPAFRG